MTDDAASAAMLRRYLADQVRTASPARRLLMLFDQVQRDLASAESGFASGDLKEISDSLVHAQQVIMALRDPLDPGTELGRALRGVYGFCLERLVEANLRKDPSLVPDVQVLIGRIAAANRAAVAQRPTVAPAEPASRALEPAHAG